mmetsp:Transcript_19342/g.54112  ORF Transcript_19342/g.54112 Transcript_19342/m.54112 type:complete len:96 (-) Transcript_19342:761-1048(-)
MNSLRAVVHTCCTNNKESKKELLHPACNLQHECFLEMDIQSTTLSFFELGRVLTCNGLREHQPSHLLRTLAFQPTQICKARSSPTGYASSDVPHV